MLQKNMMQRILILVVFLYIALLITSCKNDNRTANSDTVPLELTLLRFEKDLFNCEAESIDEDLIKLKKKYGDFFDLFFYQITRLGTSDAKMMAERVVQFIADTNLRAVYRKTGDVFGDFELEKKELENAFREYSVHFPEYQIPQIVTLISAFSYPIVVDSSTLGISLDMYLGADYHYYSTLDPPLPYFLRRKMQKDYLVADAMRGWLESDFAIDESNAKMIEMMLSQGRLLCVLDEILPETHDTLKTGYSAIQLEWCRANEASIWSFFIENKLLFSDDPNLLQKYVSDGPTTNGFPAESPGNIGKFAGWQIIKSYLKNNKQVSLKDLMNEKDLMKVFQQSKYKPEKNN